MKMRWQALCDDGEGGADAENVEEQVVSYHDGPDSNIIDSISSQKAYKAISNSFECSYSCLTDTRNFYKANANIIY